MSRINSKCASGASKRKKKRKLKKHIKLIYFAQGPHSLLKAITNIIMLIYELTVLHPCEINCIKPAFTPKTAFFGIDLYFIK